MSNFCDITPGLLKRLEELHTLAPGSIGDRLELEFIRSDPAAGLYEMRCETQSWMRNIAGTLHGGMCATLADQAMGCVAYCAKPGEGTAPTVSLNLSYHRPLLPGQAVRIRVWLVSVSRSLLHLRGELSMEDAPDRLCLSATGVYFYKEPTDRPEHRPRS